MAVGGLLNRFQSKTAQGFSSMVILKGTNPKTKEPMALPPFKLPPSFKYIAFYPTAVEARHFAATYALFRICSMKNIHMMLPPLYRDFWKNQFQELKVEDVKAGRAWMYEADPFTAQIELEEGRAKVEKQRLEREKLKAKEAEQPISLKFGNSGGGGPSKNGRTAWTKTPKVDMGKRMRANVEDIVRRNGVWNSHALDLTPDQRKSIVESLGGLGFRQSHVEEAVEECGNRDETLEWLLIHVPEDDLPRWCLPENYAAGVSMASGNLKREGSIQRLASAGYSAEICASILDASNGNEIEAAEELQARLARYKSSNDQTQPNVSSLNLNDVEDFEWKEEMSTLEAIYGSRFSNASKDACNIVLQVANAPFPFTLHVMRSSSYPATPPILWVSAQTLPAYIKLSIIRQAVGRVQEDMLGQPMIFNLVDWLEVEVLGIVERPGRLGDVAAGSSGVPVRGKNSVSSGPRRPRGSSSQVNKKAGSPKSLDILAGWTARQTTPQQQKMLSKRQSLPAWQLRDAIVRVVSAHQVTIISGETGSGKSTQAVQFILDDMIQRKIGEAANIVCTQPRRISALGLAERVSEERCSPVGDEVGYAIRGESRQKLGATKITFVTTGVLLRRLQTSGGSTEDIVAALADVSHVVVDEVHERNLDIDFLLIILREVLSKRKDLKVILMSATLDAGVFEAYFKTSTTVGKLEIQGRTHPVEDFYIDDVLRMTGFSTGQGGQKSDDQDADWDEDPSIANTIQNLGMRINYDLIVSTVRAIDAELQSREGAILVFLPGTAEINRTIDAVGRLPSVHALPLHASLTPVEQRRVFPPAPRDKRKVIAATNVAETSITIEDVVAVIDLGKVKETSFDPSSNMVKLEEVWASRAACKQRRGRAGRVQAGKCYKLYTRNAEAKMAERPEPEIRRVPLEQLCLSVRAMGIRDVPAFLTSALSPPENLAIQGALEVLMRMGALDGDELTALGRHLSLIPADLRCGKLMVYGATFGCLEACLTIAAILTARSPFLSPQDKREESKAARAAFGPDQGDLVCDLRAYEQWAEMSNYNSFRDVRLWCENNYLSSQTLRDISSNRTQYHSSLKDTGFLPTNHSQTTVHNLNRHNANNALIRALVAGAFNPQLARINFPDKKFAPSMSGAVQLDPEARTIKFFNQENGRVFVHPSSTLFGAQGFIGGNVYLSYFNKMATSKVFIRELTREYIAYPFQ